MAKQNAYLIKTSFGWWEQIRIHLANEELPSIYYLYVPDRFVLGYFKEKERKYALDSERRIFYTNKQEDLKRIKDDIFNIGKFMTAKRLAIPEQALDSLEQQVKAYCESRDKIFEATSCIDKYFFE